MTALAKSERETDTLYISASQIESFELCNRKWWFEKVQKLPKVQKPYFAFGTCLHGCLERWILSTANGRVPTINGVEKESFLPHISGPFQGQHAGARVELFPAGFETVTEKDGSSLTLTPNEVRQVKKLVAQAIERGIVTKGDEVFVEHGFTLDLIKGVKITGYLDLLRKLELPEIHDHKSFGKSSQRFLTQPGPTKGDGTRIPIVEPYEKGDGTSPNCVGHKQQNLTYAWAFCEIEGYEGPVLVRHNQFPKFEDPKGVRFVDALVGPERIKTHGAYLRRTASAMVKVSKIKAWTDTPPPKLVTACSEFGGCDFQDICGHRINLDVYSSRTERHNTRRSEEARPNFPLPKKRTKTMGSKKNIFTKAKQAAEGDEEAAPVKTSAFKRKASKPEPEEEEEDTKPKFNGGKKAAKKSATDGAPWGNPECPACLGVGINSKGNGCPICDKTAKKRGVPTSGMYEIESIDGVVMAVARKENLDEILEMDAEPEWSWEKPSSEAGVRSLKKVKAKVEEADDEEEEEADDEEEEEVPAPKKKLFARKAPAKAQDDGDEEEDSKPAKASPFKRKAAAVEPEPPEDEDEEEEAEDEAEEEVEEAPTRTGRGRGRPKGSKNKTTLQRAQEAPVAVAGRPRMSITLCMGATILHGPNRPTMTAQALLQTIGAEMATDMGAESYWELDGRKRQDRLRQRGAEIADSLGRTVVIFPGGCNDFDLIALFNGLVPHAEMVIEGLR